MDRDEFILSLARRAYAEKPFYRWFYDNSTVDVELAKVQEIPFLTKQDLFRYEEETGDRYYLPVAYPESQLNLRFTSGTTGHSLVIPWLKTEYFITWSTILINLLRHIKGRPRILAPVKPSEAEMIKSTASTFVCVLDNRMADVPYVLEVIQTRRPNVIMDSSPGLWFKYLADHGLNPRKAGIQLILAYPNQEVAQLAESWGIRYGSFFACEEAGMLGYSHSGIDDVYHLVNGEPEDAPSMALGRHGGLLARLQMATNLFPCDCYTGVDLTSLVGKRDVRIQREDGQLATTGTGRLALTCANSVFPFIKYLNGDSAELLPDANCGCGFSGRSMKFRGREHEVRIPYALGDGLCLFNLARIASELNGFERILPVYYALPGDVRIIVTFVEEKGIGAPCPDSRLAHQISVVGSGMSLDRPYGNLLKSYLPFLPVIRLPPATIPFRDRDSVKYRSYLDTVSGKVPQEYSPLLALIEQLLDLDAIVQAGNSFWMYFAKEPRPAEAFQAAVTVPTN